MPQVLYLQGPVINDQLLRPRILVSQQQVLPIFTLLLQLVNCESNAKIRRQNTRMGLPRTVTFKLLPRLITVENSFEVTSRLGTALFAQFSDLQLNMLHHLVKCELNLFALAIVLECLRKICIALLNDLRYKRIDDLVTRV